MKTFKDLTFESHGFANRIGARLRLGTMEISVIQGNGNYNDADTYEVAAFNGENEYIPLTTCDKVIGWQTKTEITNLMIILQSNMAESFVAMKERELTEYKASVA
jgi:hypothetical protein